MKTRFIMTNAHLYKVTILGFFAVFFFLPLFAFAALPAGFEIETLVTDLNVPTSIAFSTDGRIFVAEKGGAVRVIKNGNLLATSTITLTDVNTYGDRGLLGIALDPNFATNGYMYLLYTYENTPGTNIAGRKTGRLVRVTVVGDTASESSKVVLLGTVGGTITSPSCEDYATTSDCIPSDSLSHSVGGLRFGPDGKLYVTLGDGASFDYADSKALRAQNLDSLGGKMLRINTDGTGVASNPYYTGVATDNRSKVYAYGFRNSFRFNFRPTNGALFAGDVGWSTWEEVNLVNSGANYGWPCREGGGVTPLGLGCTPNGATTDPIHFYAHDVNGAGSVTGGTFPTGTAYPASFLNSYFFGDYAQNFIKRMEVNAANQTVSVTTFATGADGADGPVEFVTGPEGAIYFLGIYTGSLKKITHTLGNRQPNVVLTASPTSGSIPLTVNFSAAASTDPDGNPLTFTWSFGDGATTTLSTPSHAYTTAGSYIAAVTVRDGQGGVQTKSVTITAGNQAPSATITAPDSGTLYIPGTNIQLAGSGNDPETGALSGSALSWKVIIHHNTHTHLIQTLFGNNPTFPAPEHSDPDVYVEVELTATDPAGLVKKTSINMYLNNNTQSSGNLVYNPSFEIGEDGNPNMPDLWLKGGYGVNGPIFTYPIIGFDGAKAVSLEVVSYTDGDAKWYFSPVSISENTSYRFSDYYTATVPTTLSVQFGYNDGSYTYLSLGTVPANAQWTKVERTFQTPVDAKTMVIFHGLDRVGKMTLDAYSVMLASTTPADSVAPVVAVTSPTQGQTISGTTTLVGTASDAVGVVGLSFVVDGITTGAELITQPYQMALNTAALSNGSHTIAMRARDAAGNIGTSSVITVTVSNTSGATSTAQNLIINPGVETVSTTTPTRPYAWNNGKWGTNTTVFSYPVSGVAGNAVRVAMTARTSGDAKWFPNDIRVTPGQTYDLSLQHLSNVPTVLALRYTSSGGVVSYPTLATVPASATWKKSTYRFTVPAGMVSLTPMQILGQVGSLSTDDFSLTIVDNTKPVVNMVAPTTNQTISNTFNFQVTATDAGGVGSVRLFINNTDRGVASSSPYTFPINTAVLGNGTHSVYARATDLGGNIATSTSVTFIVNNASGTDTTNPVITLLAPAASSTVSGTVTITASSSDNVGVSNVQFFIDGAALSSPDTTVPYSIAWNTTLFSNGVHTISARARDAAGNSATATRSVTVSNTVATTSQNLIVNPSFETANGAAPLGWSQGGWGNSTRVYTYPIVGPDANKAVRVTVTNYVDGDIKWVFNDVAVSPGTLYRYDTKYRSNTISDMIGRYHFTDGSIAYFGLLKEIQPTANWTFVNATFTPPVGVDSVTLFHLISANGYIEQDDTGLFALGTTTVNTDTSAPTVAFINPTASSTVSGTVNITATSSDNVGVTYVIYAVNGNVISPQLTTAPYAFSWNSASVPNGNHILKATTHDAVGNNTAVNIPITVNQAVPPPPPPPATSTNMILNPSFEQTDVNGNPTDWFKGGWGTNTAVLSYPVAGRTGAKAAELNMTSYASGDAKWYFTPQPVVPGNSYSYSNYYKSNVPSILTVRYTLANNSFVYADVATLAPALNWTLASLTLVPPANATFVTMFHELRAVGVLTVDDYSLQSLTANTAANAFSEGMVTLTFDDGWISHYDTVLPILETANKNGSFGIVSQDTLNAVPTNRVLNASLETETVPGTPTDWSYSAFGTNDAVSAYPVSGFDGVKAAKVTITSFTDGDAKWYFKDTAVVAGQQYDFSDYYMSDVTTAVVARYDMGGGVYTYEQLGTPGAAASWTKFEKRFTIPVNVQSLTVFHRLSSAGTLTIDNAEFKKVQVYVSPAQVLQMQNAGHEIVSHTQTHASLTTVTQSQMVNEVTNSKADLLGMGATPVNTIIYPYGDYNAGVQTAAQNAGYIGARSVERGFNDKTTNKYALKTQRMDDTVTLAQVKAWIDTAEQNKTWLTLMFHQVDQSGGAFASTPQLFQGTVDYIVAKNMPVVTLSEGIAQMNP